MKLKVCGMKYHDNMTKVAELQPDYLGFIFYEKSSRCFNTSIPDLPKSIIKTGVFVNATTQFVINAITTHGLGAVQLHGNESVDYIKTLKEGLTAINTELNTIEIIKVFSIKDEFNFDVLAEFEPYIDFFLFDTKGQLKGGNGYTFDWSVLKNYPSTKPYFLSGGIGLNEAKQVQEFLKTEASKSCYALDVNSKFESEPGVKKIEELIQFKTELSI